MTNLTDIMTAADGTCTLPPSGDRYEMSGPSGSHSLAIDCTDSARLDAHWAGFVALNGGLVDRFDYLAAADRAVEFAALGDDDEAEAWANRAVTAWLDEEARLDGLA